LAGLAGGERPDLIISDYRLANRESGIAAIVRLYAAAGEWRPRSHVSSPKNECIFLMSPDRCVRSSDYVRGSLARQSNSGRLKCALPIDPWWAGLRRSYRWDCGSAWRGADAGSGFRRRRAHVGGNLKRRSRNVVFRDEALGGGVGAGGEIDSVSHAPQPDRRSWPSNSS
jgi:hypothetical protein